MDHTDLHMRLHSPETDLLRSFDALDTIGDKIASPTNHDVAERRRLSSDWSNDEFGESVASQGPWRSAYWE